MYIGIWCSPSFTDQDLFTDRLLEYSNRSDILVTIRDAATTAGATHAFIMTFAWSNKYTWEEVSREEFDTICDEYVIFTAEGCRTAHRNLNAPHQ